MTDESGADVKHPRYDVTLSDGKTTIGMMFADGRGRDDPTNIRRSPYPRTSTKINSGTGKYDDYQLPYKSIVQDNWIGGRASLNLEDDVTRFMDSYRLWTEQEKQACLSGLETYVTEYKYYDGTKYRDMHYYMPGLDSTSIEYRQLSGDSRYIATQINILEDEEFRADRLGMFVRRSGTPSGDLVLALWTDNGGAPGVELTSGTVTVENDCLDSTARLAFASITYQLEPSESYYILAYQQEGTPDSENYWEIGVDASDEKVAGETQESSDQVTWTSCAYDPYYRLMQNFVWEFKFFDYKKGKYAITKTGSIWLNGDRGACKGAQADNVIRDTDQNWTVNEWADCVVMLVNGTGSGADKPYRTIASNSSNTLTISGDDWEETPDTTTEYVILGSNKWTLGVAIGHTVTDIAVTDDIVYIAIGESNYIHRYYEYVGDDGTYYATATPEGIAKANKLLSINSPDGWELWGSMNNHIRYGTCVWKAKVPPSVSSTSDLYNLVANLFDGTTEMNEQEVNGVSQDVGESGLDISIGAGTEDSRIAASKAIEAIDITKGNHLGILIKSDAALDDGDISIALDDTPMCGRNFIPDAIFHYDTEVLPTAVIKHRSFHRPTMVLFHEHSSDTTVNTYLLESNLRDGESSYKFNPNWLNPGTTTGDELYISFPERMKGVYFNISGTASDSATGTLSYWDGQDWNAISPTADGTSDYTKSGLIYWDTIPVNWALGSDNTTDDYLASDRYHLRLTFDPVPLSTFTIDYITCMGDGNSEAPIDDQFLDMKNIYDAHWSNYSREALFYNNDSIYIRYPKRFNNVYWDISTGNSVDFTSTPYVWDGSMWQEISSGWVDNTSSSGHTLGTSGAMSFNMPDCWQPGSPSYLNEYLTDTDFVLRIKLTATTSPMTTAYTTSQIVIDKIILSDTLDEVYSWTSLDKMKDGDNDTYDYINFDSTDYLYVMFANKFDKIHFTIPSEYNDNDTTATMTLEYFNGHTWAELSFWDGTSSDGKTLSYLDPDDNPMDMYFTKPTDWQPMALQEREGYAIRMQPSATLNYGLKISEIYVKDSTQISVDIPQIVYADRFYYHEHSYDIEEFGSPDDSKIVSVGLYTDASSKSITIGRIDIITDRLEYIKIGADRINDMESYGDERLNPWVFTEGMIYEVQTQNNNAVVAIPLREIMSLSSPNNGIVHTTSDVYLVFNLGQYIQKYYQHNLEDIGLNKDEGLPDNRRGDPSSLLSFPGRLLLSLDAGDEYSTIMIRRSSAWHEIYRSPRGHSINDMSIQVIPTMNTRLWIAQEDELLWLPMPTGTWNPVQDDGFRYTNEGMLITGWISAGFLDIPKLWKSVKLYTENLEEDEQYIDCEYQEDYGNLEQCTHWHKIEEQFCESPFQERNISSGYDVSARRIRFRFKLHTTDVTKTPVLKAIIIECLLRFEVKNSYTFNYRLEDSPKDYSGANVVTRAEDIAAKLDEWSDTPTALTFRCNYSPFDDRIVVIEPYSLKPIEVESTDMLYEKHIGQITLLEI